MSGVNKVILVGYLGGDPVHRLTANGTSVANFSIATTLRWNGDDGQKQERTEWHRIVVWGKLADIASQHLKKGKQVYLEGRLQTRAWENRDGVKQYTTEVVAESLLMLGRKEERQEVPAPDAPVLVAPLSGDDADATC